MKNILADRIKDAKLTKTQIRIADYFMANPERIGSLSSMEAAREIGVSDASIIRFSRAIGFSGFSDLKAGIYDMLVENSLSNLSLSERAKKNKAPLKTHHGQMSSPLKEYLRHKQASRSSHSILWKREALAWLWTQNFCIVDILHRYLRDINPHLPILEPNIQTALDFTTSMVSSR